MNRKRLVYSLSLLFACSVVYGVYYMLIPADKSIDLDATKLITPQVLGWPERNKTDVMSIGRNAFALRRIKARIKFAEDKVYVCDNATNFFAIRLGDKITKIELQEYRVTLDEAIARVRYLSKLWGHELKGVESWKYDVTHGDSSCYNSGPILNSELPDVTIEIWKSFNADQPYFVSFKMYFGMQDQNGGVTTQPGTN